MHWKDQDEARVSPIRQLISRRMMLLGTGVAALAPALIGCQSTSAALAVSPATSSSRRSVDFQSLPLDVLDTHAVPDGYEARVLIRWGDPLRANGPAFDPANLSAKSQKEQFGFNCDYVAFVPEKGPSQQASRGVLVVNHEYASLEEMTMPGQTVPPYTADGVALEQEAVGLSVVGLVRSSQGWSVDPTSRYARRISANTPMVMSGPAAGSERLRTRKDRSGKRVVGTLGNCAGGKTPWGTVLSAEENFQSYFVGAIPQNHRESDALFLAQAGLTPADVEAAKAGAPVQRASWGLFDKRFDVSVEPREPNRFGWIVEVDPFDPMAAPIKRTALGRFRHEAATPIVNRDGRVVVYLGEDRAWGYVFRFVSRGRFDASAGVANGRLLDDGVLSVARFSDDALTWIPLVLGQNGLTPANGFETEADILIDARRAAQAAGGTPMDRPEDIDISPVTGHVFLNLTRNNDRKDMFVDAANPRPENEDGHILELVPSIVDGARDHAAERFSWNVLLLAGPVDAGGKYGSDEAAVLSGPDNLAFDPQGRLWIATDNRRWSWIKPVPNGLYACAVEGPDRAVTRLFCNVPKGAEATGPEFTPDGETLFLAIQHPGEDVKPKPEKSWPDFKAGVPGRPAVVVVSRKGGGPIGGRAGD
jgi:secreted PhoX family phosphatase